VFGQQRPQPAAQISDRGLIIIMVEKKQQKTFRHVQKASSPTAILSEIYQTLNKKKHARQIYK